eukprot:GEMP01087077.1.p1 GENE.GEMP01087077.1~~GEMP01087077.1.p1  ORF type:complete len:135 (+),score=20.79 GEMP01087077.1:346-750(+)
MNVGHAASSASGALLRPSVENSTPPKLPDGTGMLFLGKNDQRCVLYMRNTYVPLGAAWFYSNGTLAEHLRPMTPLSEKYEWSQSDQIRYELEVDPDFFANNGFDRPGQTRIDVDAIRSAVEARGFSPDEYAPLA